jgi:hypothetical protein
MMQEAARLFEAGIRAHPQDWHMLHRVFAADLDPGGGLRLAASQRYGRKVAALLPGPFLAPISLHAEGLVPESSSRP